MADDDGADSTNPLVFAEVRKILADKFPAAHVSDAVVKAVAVYGGAFASIVVAESLRIAKTNKKPNASRLTLDDETVVTATKVRSRGGSIENSPRDCLVY